MFSTSLSDEELDVLQRQIQTKGDEIRELKAAGTTDKESLAPHIAELLALKAKLPGAAEPPKKKKQPPPPQKQKKQRKAPAPPPEATMSASELRLTRLAKVDRMKEAGVEPFAYTYETTHTAKELLALYDGDKLTAGQEDTSADVAIAGRIMTRRVFGKLAFFTIQDDTGTIQLQLDKGRLGDAFKVCTYVLVVLCVHGCTTTAITLSHSAECQRLDGRR